MAETLWGHPPLLPRLCHSGSVQTPNSGSIAWVTWLRIVAVYAVVMIHTAGSTAAGTGSTTSPDGWVARALDMSFMWAVPVFVMLSGTLGLDPGHFRGSAHYLRKRAWRLVPPLLFWNAVYLAYAIATRPNWGSGWQDAIGLVLIGDVAPHLYFFWIVLGLSVVTPVLIPWLAQLPRRGWVIAAVVAWSIPILSSWPLLPGGQSLGVHESAWTWWIPYLGAYLMGGALREVRLPRWAVGPAALVAIGLMALLTWQWQNPAVPAWLQDWFPANYYGLTVAVLSCLVFLLGQAVFRPDGVLRALTRPRVRRYADPVGRATLGIFALHFLVLVVGTTTGVLGRPETTWPVVLLRFVIVSALTTAIVLVFRKVPVARKVL